MQTLAAALGAAVLLVNFGCGKNDSGDPMGAAKWPRRVAREAVFA
jgi:hypothetical protein